MMRMNACPAGQLKCIRAQGLTVRIGGHTVLEDVDLHVHSGEMTVLMGPNGAGKSTLIRALIGMQPHEGRLWFEDKCGRTTGMPRVGYVPQQLPVDPALPVSVLDLFAMTLSRAPVWLGARRGMRGRARASLEVVEAVALIDRPLGALSGGELQRVMLALALTPQPDLLLLDEPFSGVDRRGLALLYALLDSIRKRYDVSIVMVSHQPDLAYQYADRVILMDGRKILDGPARQVLADERFQSLLGNTYLKSRAGEEDA